MGETGCGKTSLIRFFSKNILNDELEIFNIHAGVTA
jgi:ABC-type phosphate transport system ATPase subunit